MRVPSLRRLLPTSSDSAAYLVILMACVSGIGDVPWWAGVILPSLVLSLIGWPRWRDLVLKAAHLDAQWIEHGMPWRARNLFIVLGGNFLNTCFFTGLAFAFGHLTRWLWFG